MHDISDVQKKYTNLKDLSFGNLIVSHGPFSSGRNPVYKNKPPN